MAGRRVPAGVKTVAAGPAAVASASAARLTIVATRPTIARARPRTAPEGPTIARACPTIARARTIRPPKRHLARRRRRAARRREPGMDKAGAGAAGAVDRVPTHPRRPRETTMKRLIIAPIILALSVAPALAHHGWSGYDGSKELTLTGVIQESGYEHPHGHVRLDVQGKTWRVVLAPPSRMESRGLSKEALAVGTPATVMGYPHRSDPTELRAERITIAGKTTELR